MDKINQWNLQLNIVDNFINISMRIIKLFIK